MKKRNIRISRGTTRTRTRTRMYAGLHASESSPTNDICSLIIMIVVLAPGYIHARPGLRGGGGGVGQLDVPRLAPDFNITQHGSTCQGKRHCSLLRYTPVRATNARDSPRVYSTSSTPYHTVYGIPSVFPNRSYGLIRSVIQQFISVMVFSILYQYICRPFEVDLV